VATRKLFKQVIRLFGKIDVLINNAAIAINSPINSEQWQDDWDETMAVNLRAVAILSRLAIIEFRKTGGGRIINVSSRAAFRGDTADYMAYAASKGAVLNLTKSIAKNFGKEGVKCFALAPGFVNTDMAKPFIEKYGKEFTTSDIALENLTEPKDVAAFAVFLASGLADHATGTHIDINAGSYLH
jgi:NAD(P)-dependent dehydrogenase (short-subunit alcohol dehydrogenase family)